MGRSRLLEPSPIGLIGGVLAIISCFLAWGEYSDTFDVPLEFLWDEDATGGVELGIPLVSVAGVVTLFSVTAMEPFVFLRRLGGVVLLAATALFVVQLGRDIGWDNLSAGNIEAGPYLAGAGGLLALLSPPGLWPFVRGRPRPAPARAAAAPPPPSDEESPTTARAGAAPPPPSDEESPTTARAGAAPPPPPDEPSPTMPPGWYSDPEGGGQRYWDGKNWTDYRAE
jgi:hypothetical protein